MRIDDRKTETRPFLKGASSTDVAMAMAKHLYKRLAKDIALYRIDSTIMADYYIICNGRSNTHMKALAEELMYEMELCGITESRMEGKYGSSWILVDFGEVIVHIFDRESREFYHLDRLMSEDQKIELQFDEEETEE